jgi:hypothetical protein
MKFKALILLILLTVFVLSAAAQDVEPTTHTLRLDNIAFDYSTDFARHVNVMQHPATLEDLGKGFTNAVHTLFELYNMAEDGTITPKGGMRVYAIEDLAAYDWMREEVEQLRQLVAEKPDLQTFEGMGENTLPYIPMPTHGQTIRARAEYIETGAFTGIGYITSFMAVLEPFSSHSFSYTVQAISTDGTYYISASFHITLPLFSDELPEDFSMDTFQANFADYIAESTASLNEAAPQEFNPSLDAIKGVISTLRFE